jgi:hypothetical protein
MKLFPNSILVVRFIPAIIAALLLCGCPKVEKKQDIGPMSAKKNATAARPSADIGSEGKIPGESVATSGPESTGMAKQPSETTSTSTNILEDENNPEFQPVEKPRDLGPPLVDNPETLKKMHPNYPVWIDPVKKQVVLVGEICQTNVPLEMFACLRGTKEHESIVDVPTEAFIVHGALLAIGAKAGAPVQFAPQYVPTTGSEIDITVRWKNSAGEIKTARAQDWVRDINTGKSLEQPWIFGGSGFWKDESTNKEYYQAEGGDFICVANFPSAMLDLPIKSSESNAELLFQAFTERIPPQGTPVTLILTPKAERRDSEP